MRSSNINFVLLLTFIVIPSDSRRIKLEGIRPNFENFLGNYRLGKSIKSLALKQQVENASEVASSEVDLNKYTVKKSTNIPYRYPWQFRQA